jgi:hypothetical protein
LRTGDVASLNVVQKRLTANSLSAAQIQDIIAAALKAQADPNRPWLPQWGDLFEDADARGNVLPAQLQQYLRHCLPLTLAPDAVHEGELYLSFTVTAPKARVGSSNRWWLQLTAPHPQRDDNYAADENVIGHAGAPLLNGGRITQTWLIRPDLDLTRGAPRKQSLHVRVPVKIFDNHVPGHVLAEWSEPLDGTWDLLPPLKPSAGASAGGAP